MTTNRKLLGKLPKSTTLDHLEWPLRTRFKMDRPMSFGARYENLNYCGIVQSRCDSTTFLFHVSHCVRRVRVSVFVLLRFYAAVEIF